MTQLVDNYKLYLDMINSVFEYHFFRINQDKAFTKDQNGSEARDIELTADQKLKYKTGINTARTYLTNVSKLLVGNYNRPNTNLDFDGTHFNFFMIFVTPNYKFETVEATKIKNYRGHIDFIDCLSVAMEEQYGDSFFQTWAVVVDFYTNPFIYDKLVTEPQISSVIDLTFFEFNTKEQVVINKCGDKPMNIYTPITTISQLNKINDQYSLFDPNNYKAPDDEIFRAPIYISPEGIVSDDTVEQRIEVFFRKYNSSCSYYDENPEVFATDGMNFFNISNGFIQCQANHTTDFSNFIIDNVGVFSIDGRFFYLKHPAVFFNGSNYGSNFVFFIILIILIYCVVLTIITYVYDYGMFKQEVLIEFLRKQTQKVSEPYALKQQVKANAINPFEFREGEQNEFNVDNNPLGVVNDNREVNNEDPFGLNMFDNEEEGGGFDEDDKAPAEIQVKPKEEDNADDDVFGFESIRIEDDNNKVNQESGDLAASREQKMNNFLVNQGEPGGIEIDFGG